MEVKTTRHTETRSTWGHFGENEKLHNMHKVDRL